MKQLSFKQMLTLLGYLFVFLVSIVAAIKAEGVIFKVILSLSSIISLILAIDRIMSFSQLMNRVQEIEENQLSFSVDDDEHILKVERGQKK